MDHDSTSEELVRLPAPGGAAFRHHDSHGCELRGEEAAIDARNGSRLAHALGDLSSSGPVFGLIKHLERVAAAVEQNDLKIDGACARLVQ